MKPSTITPNYDALPAELRQRPIWLLWDYRQIKGRWSKVPLIADESGRTARSNDHRTWRPFADARRFVDRATGIGLCITDKFCGVDLDNCRDKETGVIAPWAARIVDLLNSYAEISPGGSGLHIIIKLKRELPAGRRMRGGKERSGWEIAIFDRSSPRYFAVTGVLLDGRGEIRDVDPQEFWPEFEMGDFDPGHTKVNGKVNGHANGRELNKRKRLIDGAWHGLYPSQSEADSALVWFFAYDYGDDGELIDRAFRNSGMMRPKWDEPRPGGTYGSVTIAHVLEEKRKRSQNGELLLDADGKPRVNLTNCVALMRLSAEWEGVLAYDLFSQRTVTKNPAPWQSTGADWTDADDSQACIWLQRHGMGNVKTHVVAEAVQILARENAFHPVREYLTSVVWDGKERIGGWLRAYLGAPDSEFTRAVGSRWLISAVARVFEPGCPADHVLVLEGPQGIRKSTALRTLAGDPFFTDHVSELGGKDSRVELVGRWIIEHSELDRIRRGDIERVKSFITCRVDNFRLPYGRRTEEVPRQCIFAGSTNNKNPLTDETGNRRFWPIRCGEILIGALSEDRDQLWAEAYHAYKCGHPWWLETVELNGFAVEEQEKRYEPGALDDLILEWAENPTRRQVREGANGEMIPLTPFDSEPGKVTALDVLLHCLGKPLHLCDDQRAKNQVARCMVHAGWERVQLRTSGRRLWFYVKGGGDGR